MRKKTGIGKLTLVNKKSSEYVVKLIGKLRMESIDKECKKNNSQNQELVSV